jgi:hypothetical protein
LNNWRHHAEDRAHRGWCTDPFSSAELFDGWDGKPMACLPRGEPRPVAPAQFWLTTKGWRRHGLIGLRETPGPRS